MVSCLRLRNELSKETHVLTKQEAFIGKRNPGGEQQDKGTQENCFVALPFYDDGVSFWVVSGHSDSQLILVAHALLSQDGLQ